MSSFLSKMCCWMEANLYYLSFVDSYRNTDLPRNSLQLLSKTRLQWKNAPVIPDATGALILLRMRELLTTLQLPDRNVYSTASLLRTHVRVQFSEYFSQHYFCISYHIILCWVVTSTLLIYWMPVDIGEREQRWIVKTTILIPSPVLWTGQIRRQNDVSPEVT